MAREMHKNSLANLKQGGTANNSSGKQKLGAAFRNAFTKEDMENTAKWLLEIAGNPENKLADRIKAMETYLKKVVADEVADEGETLNLDTLMEELKNAGFTLTPISKSSTEIQQETTI